MTDLNKGEGDNQLQLFNAFINVDFKTFGKTTDKLIDTVAKGLGLAYQPYHIKKMTEALQDAGDKFGFTKKEQKEIFLNLIFSQRQVQHQRKNVEAIVQKTVDSLPETVDEKPVDEDWITHFLENCKNVSNEEMQSLWAKLLSGEVAKPGSFSKRTVDFVSLLSPEEAQMFTDFCGFLLVEDKTNFPFIGPLRIIAAYAEDEKGFTRGHLEHLIDIGLVERYPLGVSRKGAEWKCHYFEKELKITFSHNLEMFSHTQIELLRLTNIGRELYPISGRQTDYKLLERLKEASMQKDYMVIDSST